MSTKVVAVLGATGRLGPAVVRALDGLVVRGLSRRAPTDDEAVGAPVTIAERRDVAALARIVDGAAVVVDLVCFDEADADALLAAMRAAGGPRHVIFASSIAELEDDEYGRGKRAARRRYEAEPGLLVHTLMLPRLVATVDPSRREQAYLDAASSGPALHAGSGAQRQTIAPVDGVAAVVRALIDDPACAPPGAIAVGPPAPVRIADAISALLEGAGFAARTARHPDPGWRGPHGGGDEILDTSALARLLPSLAWPDVLAIHRELGAWLAARPATARRPRRLVATRHQEHRGHAVVDVHGRRDPSPANASAELAELASWLTPSFYLDVGRPCNSACLYCAVPPHLDTEGFAPRERLAAQMDAGVSAGCDRAILIGGEPTIYPHLFHALGDLRARGLEGHVVMTNGIRSADAGFVARLIDAGVATMHLSLDTSDEAVYDRLSRTPGSFGAQRAALANALRRTDLHLYVYCAVTKINAPGLGDHLRAIAREAADANRAPPPVLLAFLKPIGDARTHAADLALAPRERAAIAVEAAATAAELGAPLGTRNLQVCLAPALARLDVDSYLEDYSVDLVTHARVPYAHRDEYSTYVEACARCSHRPACSGIYSEDVRAYGASLYAPLPRAD